MIITLLFVQHIFIFLKIHLYLVYHMQNEIQKDRISYTKERRFTH